MLSQVINTKRNNQTYTHLINNDIQKQQNSKKKKKYKHFGVLFTKINKIIFRNGTN